MIHTNMRSLTTDFAKIASLQPDKIALLDSQGRILTYSGLSQQIENAHAWLKSMKLQPGDTVMALMPNAIETVILFLACLHGGYTYAPLPCTATHAEVTRWKALTRARVCLFAHSLTSHFKEQVMQLDWVTQSIAIGEKNMSWPIDGYAESIGGGKLVMGSSGSTGEPKAMLLDSDRLWSAGKAFLRYHGIENSDIRFWNYLPMSYLGGLFNLTLIPLAAGGSIYIDEAFNGKTFLVFWATIERLKINSIWLVPTILRGLLTLSHRVAEMIERPKLTYCFLGTAPVSLEEKQRFSDLFGIVPFENYGLSETTFISSEHAENIALRKEGSVGGIMPDIDVKLVSIEEEECSVNEICVRTPYAMLGYLDSEGTLKSSVNSEGYLATGDCGQIVDGQLQLTGRRKDIIKKGGILIVLRELELVAEAYPNVLEAAAVRIEHSFYGESCILYVRTNDAVSNTEKFIIELQKWLHEQLVRHKWPEKIICCEQFPRTESGKVKKAVLAQRSVIYAE